MPKVYTPSPPPRYEKPKRHLNDGVNRDKLRAALARRGKTQAQVAAALGKDPALVSNKLTGRAPFKASDIQFFYSFLKLTPVEAVEIFFNAPTTLQPSTTGNNRARL